MVFVAVLTSCDAAVGIAGFDDRGSGPDLSLAEIQMISGDEQEGRVASLAPERLVVEVTDEHGDPLSGAPVEWAFMQGRGIAAEGSPPRELLQAVTDAQGRSEVQWELGTTAGVQQAWARIVVPDDPAAASDGPAGAPNTGKGKKVGFNARAKPAAPDEVSISPSSLSAALGDSARLQAEVTDKFGNEVQDADLEWRSSNEAVAQVDDTGLVTTVDDGSAEIMAAAGAAEGTADLIVTAEAPPDAVIADVIVTPSQLTLAEGDTATVIATALDGSGDPVGGADIDWTSSDSTIASVSSEGLVKANSIGAILVAATVACGMSACSATTEVQVQQGGTEEPGTPGTVTDLTVVDATGASLTLAFTQVDDGTGNPAKYAVRHGSPTMSWGPASPTELSIDGTQIGAVLEYPHNGLETGEEYEFQLVAYRGTLGSATFGGLSNIAAATTLAVEPGDPASLTVSPSSATIGIGRTIQLIVDVRDADGIAVPDAPIGWSTSNPSIATVSSEGVVSGTGIGMAVITASLMCGGVACSAGTTDNGQVNVQEVPTGNHANEPAGFTMIADNPFDVEQLLGWTAFGSTLENLSIQTDASAPTSPSNVGAALFHEGFDGGSGPINLTHPIGAAEFYLHFALKLSANWYSHSAGVKLFFIRNDGKGDIYLITKPTGDVAADPLRLFVQTQNVVGGNVGRSGNVGDATVLRDTWYDIEVIIRSDSSPGAGDGEVHVWIDGTKTHEYTNASLLRAGADRVQDILQWNPTFGGGDHESVPADQYQYIDHIYISGN
jgi:uncharacterized protein YjdB